MEMLKFYFDNVLGPVFGNDRHLIERPALLEADAPRRPKAAPGAWLKRQGKQEKEEEEEANATGDAMLDLSGPPIIEGLTSWILFYRLIGHINLPRVPLYVTLIYKICLLAASNFVLLRNFVLPLLFARVLASGQSNQNPIFIVMSLLTLLFSALNLLAISYKSLFKLSPLFKLLTTPKLCFITRRTQLSCGDATLAYMLLFIVYYTLLLRAQVSASFADFIANFSLASFLTEMFAVAICVFYTIGLAHVDFYVRFCFSAWLLALKCNLEYRAARFNQLRAQLKRRKRGELEGEELEDELEEELEIEAEERRVLRAFKRQYAFIKLDEVQKSLNTMDDHLEVCRSVDTSSLVFITLNAFLATGTMLIIAYNMLTKDHDAFHGSCMILIALNYAILVTACYLGDSFLYYALSGFVQAVEDEYFLQAPGGSARGRLLDRLPPRRGAWSSCSQATLSLPSAKELAGAVQAKRTAPARGSGAPSGNFAADSLSIASTADDSAAEARRAGATNASCLAIKKVEVLFCRELLHQFETHLATPWSKLSFKSHMSMVVTFVELIAAQIIFEHEHS